MNIGKAVYLINRAAKQCKGEKQKNLYDLKAKANICMDFLEREKITLAIHIKYDGSFFLYRQYKAEDGHTYGFHSPIDSKWIYQHVDNLPPIKAWINKQKNIVPSSISNEEIKEATACIQDYLRKAEKKGVHFVDNDDDDDDWDFYETLLRNC